MDDVDYLGASGIVLSYNLYSYCENNPVIYSDSLMPMGNAFAPRLARQQEKSKHVCRKNWQVKPIFKWARLAQ